MATKEDDPVSLDELIVTALVANTGEIAGHLQRQSRGDK
jgi:hypothetical protein